MPRSKSDNKMFYLGIYFDETVDSAPLVILRKKFINVKKHYYIDEIRACFLPADIEQTQCKIDNICSDRKYIKTKRVFSQDKRPARIILAPPIIVAGSATKNGKINLLRKKRIPIEGVFIQDGNGWRKEEYHRICLGNNYFVPRAVLFNCLMNVYSQNRLIFEIDMAAADDLEKSLDACSDGVFNKNHSSIRTPPDDLKAMLFSLAIPIWFCENVREIKRY